MPNATMDPSKLSKFLAFAIAKLLQLRRNPVVAAPLTHASPTPNVQHSATPVRSRLILHPNSRRSMAWRAFASACAVLHAWVVPIFGLFDPPEDSFVMIIFRFTWAMLIVDVLVCMCTAKVDRDGDMVSTTLAECAVSYWREKRGYIDFLALIPFDTRALHDIFATRSLAELSHTNRLLVLYRVGRWVRHMNDEVVLNMHVMWIVQSTIIGFLGINWMAALWWTIGQMDASMRDGKPSWVEMASASPRWKHVFHKNADGSWNASWEERYGLACYWVINSALIPEHSHFSVPSFQERWIGKVFYALTQTFLVWVAGSFTSSLANQRANRALFQRRADVMAEFLETSHLSKGMQQRVTAYMNHVWQRTRGIDPFTLLDDLPSTVHAELAMKAYKHLLVNVPLFQGADVAFLRAVCLALRPILFMAGDYIIRTGDLGAEMYLVLRGDVEIVSVDAVGRETILSTMHTGAYFGEISLYLSRPRTVSVRAKTTVDILVLPKHHLDPILKMYPDVHARIMSIAQEHLLKDAARRGSEQSETAQAADTRLFYAPATPLTPAITLEPASVLLRTQNGQYDKKLLARALSGRTPSASPETDVAPTVDAQRGKKRSTQEYRVVTIDNDDNIDELDVTTAVNSPVRPRRPSASSVPSAEGSRMISGSNGVALKPWHIQSVLNTSAASKTPLEVSPSDGTRDPSASFEQRSGNNLKVPVPKETTHGATQPRQRSTSDSISRRRALRNPLLRTRLFSDGVSREQTRATQRQGDNTSPDERNRHPTSQLLPTPHQLLHAQPLLSSPHSQPLANIDPAGRDSSTQRATSNPDRLTNLIRTLTQSGRLSQVPQQGPDVNARGAISSAGGQIVQGIEPLPYSTQAATTPPASSSTNHNHENGDAAAEESEESDAQAHVSLDFLFFNVVPLDSPPSTPFQSLDRSTAKSAGAGGDKQSPSQ